MGKSNSLINFVKRYCTRVSENVAINKSENWTALANAPRWIIFLSLSGAAKYHCLVPLLCIESYTWNRTLHEGIRDHRIMQFQGFDWLSGHGIEPLHRVGEIETIKLCSGCSSKAKSTRSSNISWFFLINQLLHARLLDLRLQLTRRYAPRWLSII